MTQERLVGLSILSRETYIVEKINVKQLTCTISRSKADKLSFNGILIASIYYEINNKIRFMSNNNCMCRSSGRAV